MPIKRVAVVGGGVSGLATAYILAKDGAEVVVYEKDDTLGGHAKTVIVDGTSLDLGFMVFNCVVYPDTMELFENLGVDRELSDLSFSVSLDEGQGCEWGTRNGLSSLFAQKTNVLNPYFWNMIREIIKFKDDASAYVDELENNPDIDRNETLEHFIRSRGYSELFQKAFLIPTCASIWSCTSGVMSFSAYSMLSFLRNNPTLQRVGCPQRLTPRWHSQSYVNRVKKELESRCCQIRMNSEVYSVLTNDEGEYRLCCNLQDGSEEVFDGCIIATQARDALKMLGKQATHDELRILGAFQYAHSDIFLHRDNNLMPKKPAVWSSRNFLGTMDKKTYVTYWLNDIQCKGDSNSSTNECAEDWWSGLPFFLTLNPPRTPKSTLFKWSTSHPIPSVAASKASHELNIIQGNRRLWFCGAYQGYGFPEDGVKAGILAAHNWLRKGYTVQNNLKQMVPSWAETAARGLVLRFLERFVSTGCITLQQKLILAFPMPTLMDFSFVDKNEGLLNFFLIFIANTELNTYMKGLNKKRGWWTPLLYTSILASVKYSLKHILRQNTLTQARQNISEHYDLSNELFSLFLDETMTYSCAIFQTPDEDFKKAQLRKIHTLIDKSRISKEHHVLEIGCGWGSLALEVVKRTGCRYTGITLSEKQLQYAEQKVKEAGQQDQIQLLLCDYRQLPKGYKYDRIISCEMIEAVGHEYIEEFFRCCESALTENGIFVLQFTSVADEKYDEFRLSPGFIKEYISPVDVCLRSAVQHLLWLLHPDLGNLLPSDSMRLSCGNGNIILIMLPLDLNIVFSGLSDCILSTWRCRAAFGNKPYNATPGDH
ncbi:UNVERIFIED_CONTAM: Tuberculostearic acid methyltransferase UfaA1 [Sesamum calycinum]|uniref:Tuberculostearic acid methyltransferase UfaA1 n=1 Tax=Sesamum calycinum TaxID=2727403 RepID=A0AAW2R9Z3_9LAMI